MLYYEEDGCRTQAFPEKVKQLNAWDGPVEARKKIINK